MTPSSPPPSPPALPSAGDLTPFESVECLLKKPLSLFTHIQQGKGGVINRYLLITAAICLLTFGLIVGLFSFDSSNPDAVRQLWAAPLKITFGVFFSGLICLPSLYIFGCLSGLDLKFNSTIGVLVASLALATLLLLGFTPVVWIFALSTDSLVFMGLLLFAFWAISLFFASALLLKATTIFGGKAKGHPQRLDWDLCPGHPTNAHRHSPHHWHRANAFASTGREDVFPRTLGPRHDWQSTNG